MENFIFHTKVAEEQSSSQLVCPPLLFSFLHVLCVTFLTLLYQHQQ